MTEKKYSKIDGMERWSVTCEHEFKGQICGNEITQIFLPDNPELQSELNSPTFLLYCDRCKGVVIFRFEKNELKTTFTNNNKYANNSFFNPASPPGRRFQKSSE
jgi:hypothetical protein